MAQTSLSSNSTYSSFNSPLIDKVITYKNIKPNYSLIKNLPAHNYIKCFCPIHGDQPDNDKHKCSLFNGNGKRCISSLRYNCAHCDNENGRSLSHIAFQKHLRIYHSGIIEKMKIKDSIEKSVAYSPVITSIPPIKKNGISRNKNENISSYEKSINSYLHSKRNLINISKKENSIPCHKIQINSFKLNKSRNISVATTNEFRDTHSSPFISLQLICACELLIEKTLEVVFHESYLSYDIPMKLMILKYALNDNKIYCDDSCKEKMIKCIENLENYFNVNIKMDSFELERELRIFLQFLLNYTKN